MTRLILLLFLVTSTGIVFGQQSAPKASIIPEPVSLNYQSGEYVLGASSAVYVSSDDKDAVRVGQWLADALSKPTGFNISLKTGAAAAASTGNILLSLNAKADPALGKEGYALSAGNAGVTIKANTAAGLFYGMQTLLQLFPPSIESKNPVKDVRWAAPAVDITDYPRFGWRGLMFDVSRHFFTKQEVKEFIDDMVRYKFNLLHFHLTDDEGWRIEIKSLPKLTQVGAWNVKKTGTFGTFSQPTPDEPRTNGGFYTQDDIKELIQYAKERFVDILPEIEMPGHSAATVTSYPELSCSQGPFRVISGEKFINWYPGGHSAIMDNTLCPANEAVYQFVDKVMTEVAQLFPFPFIHVGGDECSKNFWEKSDAIKKLMAKEKLKDQNEVQSYFMKRVEKIVQSKGKKMIGWDEILEGGLAPNAAVMSWRGMKGGIEAAKQGHQVVMSPTTFAYLDFMQSDAVMEPPVYATLRLNKTYQFEPVPDGIDPKLIIGGQANLWTEQVYNMRHLQYMLWPRSFAVAEALWSPKEKRNWNNFVPRVEDQFKRYDIAEKKYAPSMYDPIFTVSRDTTKPLTVTLTTEIDGLDTYYSFDNSFPDQFYPKATGPIVVPKDASTMKVITYRGKEPIGRMTVMPVAELKKRARRGEE